MQNWPFMMQTTIATMVTVTTKVTASILYTTG